MISNIVRINKYFLFTLHHLFFNSCGQSMTHFFRVYDKKGDILNYKFYCTASNNVQTIKICDEFKARNVTKVILKT